MIVRLIEEGDHTFKYRQYQTDDLFAAAWQQNRPREEFVVCHKCSGMGKIVRVLTGETTGNTLENCPACRGSGQVPAHGVPADLG